MDDIDEIEKILCESNKGHVTLIGDGLTKQFFIELSYQTDVHGPLYMHYVHNNSWLRPFSAEPDSATYGRKSSLFVETSESIFPTEVDDEQTTIMHETLNRLKNASTVSVRVATEQNQVFGKLYFW